MQQMFIRSKQAEVSALVILLVFLGAASLADIVIGFTLPILVGLVFPMALLAFFFPRAGLLASISMTVVFERFYTLSPLLVGDAAYKLYPLDIVLAASFVSALLLFLRERGCFARFDIPDWFLIAFFLIVTAIFSASMFSGGDVSIATAFSTWKNYVFYGVLFFLTAFLIRTREDLVFFSKLFLGSVAVALIFLIIGVLRGGGLWTEYTPLSTEGTRYLAFPHAFYYSLALLALLLSASYHAEDLAWRKWRIVFIAFLGVGVLASLMRHLWLGLAGTITLGFTLFAWGGRREMVRITVVFAGVTLFVVAFVFSILSLFPQSDATLLMGEARGIVSERITSIGNRYDESLAWREEVWKSALTRFSETPLLGIGFGASVPVELGEYHEYVEVRNMHNSWLALLIQTGLVGVAAIFGFLVMLVWGLFRRRYRDPFLIPARAVLLGVIAFQCAVFFSQPYLETNLLGIFFWITLGLARSMIGMRD